MLGFLPSLQFAGTVDSLVDDDIADQLVAALRESLSNAARHAHASQVLVAVVVADGDVVLTVLDDGVGITEGGRRSGLANLAARAHELGGTFVVEPRISGGTQLTWRVPLG
jgi:signal transduction histidine kinase